MEHKAFIFDWEAFINLLSSALENALLTGETEALVNFINANIDSLKDPYEGLPLDADWEATVGEKDAHQYGDFALTKFYNPALDVGLGYDWENIHNLLSRELGENISIVLGQPFGPPQNYFDPGKIGSYFQFPDQVKQNLERVQNLIHQKPELEPEFQYLLPMLHQALEAGKGLYITF